MAEIMFGECLCSNNRYFYEQLLGIQDFFVIALGKILLLYLNFNKPEKSKRPSFAYYS